VIDCDRFKLLGTYRTPRFRYGAVVMDDIRGWVRIVGLSDGPIPWPIGQLGRGGRQRFLILFGALARAVRRESNQAVAHHWGVTPQTVTVWRKALEVRTVNDGTHRLLRERALTPAFREQTLTKAWAKAQDPHRRAKISAAHRGKKLSNDQRLLLRWANLGRCPSEATRRKMRAAALRRGARPPKAVRLWTKAEDRAVRTLRPAAAAAKTGRTLSAVFSRRYTLRVSDGRASAARKGELRDTAFRRYEQAKRTSLNAEH
jgi:hypothetical protein